MLILYFSPYNFFKKSSHYLDDEKSATTINTRNSLVLNNAQQCRN